MNFNYTSKIYLFIFLIFISSCQDKLTILNKNENLSSNENIKQDITSDNDIDITKLKNSKIVEFFDNGLNFNLSENNLERIKINNSINKKNNLPIDFIHIDNNFYTIDSKLNILEYEAQTGKLIETYQINFSPKNRMPISFSLLKTNFVIGFKSGEVISTDKSGKVLWIYNGKTLLNTSIKIYEDILIVLYPEDIIILSPENGEVIYKKNYKSSKIIQSSGGQIYNHFNIVYFLLPNSEFHALDTFLFEEHFSRLNEIELITSLNNLNDKIYVHKNLFIYLDNGNIINSYDLINNEFLISNQRLNNIGSSLFFNNILITKSENKIEFYNIYNGDLLKKINIEKLLKKESKIIKVLNINKKIHIFNSDGNLLIINDDLAVDKIIDLKINKINKVYNSQNNIYISTKRGNTFIY